MYWVVCYWHGRVDIGECRIVMAIFTYFGSIAAVRLGFHRVDRIAGLLAAA